MVDADASTSQQMSPSTQHSIQLIPARYFFSCQNTRFRFSIYIEVFLDADALTSQQRPQLIQQRGFRDDLLLLVGAQVSQ